MRTCSTPHSPWCDECRTERDRLREENESRSDALQELAQEADQLREENERLKFQIECADTPLMRDVMNERDNLRVENERLEGVIARCDKEIDELTSEIVDLQVPLSAAEEDHEAA